MAFYVDGYEVTAESIRNAIDYNYPGTFNYVESATNPLYDFVFLFGIRVDTCDTGLPDDYLGAIRYEPNSFSSGGKWEMILTDGTTDPSPDFVRPGVYYDAESKLKGGASWVREGQHYYKWGGYKGGYPAWSPVGVRDVNGKWLGIPVYRWLPTRVGEKFDKSKAKLSYSSDCMIHRSWSSQRFSNDSAGCQVFKNNALLNDLKKWTDAHDRHSTYPKRYLYTLLTREQFIAQFKRPQWSWGIGMW